MSAMLAGCAATTSAPEPPVVPDAPAGTPQWWTVHVRKNARSAWLHHLNALFGYQPVLIQEQRLMRF